MVSMVITSQKNKIIILHSTRSNRNQLLTGRYPNFLIIVRIHEIGIYYSI